MCELTLQMILLSLNVFNIGLRCNLQFWAQQFYKVWGSDVDEWWWDI